jgi:hypothetical protein
MSKLSCPGVTLSWLTVQSDARCDLPNDLVHVSAVTQLRTLTLRGGCAGIPGITIVMVVVISHNPSFIGGAAGGWGKPASSTPITTPDFTINAFITAHLHAIVKKA